MENNVNRVKYNIFILKNENDKTDNGLVKIADVFENNNIEIKNQDVNNVNIQNKKLCDIIVKNNSLLVDDEIRKKILFKPIITSDILSIIVDIIFWRRATAFLVIQKSDIGIRYLCYITNKITHYGQSFGIDINYVINNSIRDIKNRFISSISEAIEHINEYPNIAQDLLNMNNTINTNFGL